MYSPQEYKNGDKVVAEIHKDFESVNIRNFLINGFTPEAEYIKNSFLNFYTKIGSKREVFLIFGEEIVFKKDTDTDLNGLKENKELKLLNYFKQTTSYPLNNPLYFYNKDCWNISKEKEAPLSFWGKVGQKFILSFEKKDDYLEKFLSVNKPFYAKGAEQQGTFTTVINDLKSLIKKSDWKTVDDFNDHFGPRNLKLLQEVMNKENLGKFFLSFANDKNNSVGDCFRLVFVLEKIAKGINGQKVTVEGEALYIHKKISNEILKDFKEKSSYNQVNYLPEETISKASWALILAQEICSPKKKDVIELNFLLNFSNGFKPNLLDAVQELKDRKNNIFKLSDEKYTGRFNSALVNQKINLFNFVNSLGGNASEDFKKELEEELKVHLKNNNLLKGQDSVKSKISIVTIKKYFLPWVKDQNLCDMFNLAGEFDEDYENDRMKKFEFKTANFFINIIKNIHTELNKSLSKGTEFSNITNDYHIKDESIDFVVLSEMAKQILVDMLINLMDKIYSNETVGILNEDIAHNDMDDIRRSIRTQIKEAGLVEFVKAYELKNDLLKNMEVTNPLLTEKDDESNKNNKDMDDFMLKI